MYFNNKLLRGNRVTKMNSSGYDAFSSPNIPPLATVGIDINSEGVKVCMCVCELWPPYSWVGCHSEAVQTGEVRSSYKDEQQCWYTTFLPRDHGQICKYLVIWTDMFLWKQKVFTAYDIFELYIKTLKLLNCLSLNFEHV